MKIEQATTATWAQMGTERVLDLVTMVIAYLYWKICDADDRATLEGLRVSANGSTQSCPRSLPQAVR